MSKIIIGIHGLANKPAKEVLEQHWKMAIAEGLKFNQKHRQDFDFELVYWADLLYKRPLHVDSNFASDDSFDSEPYYATTSADLTSYNDGIVDELRAGVLDLAGLTIDGLKSQFGMNALVDRLLGFVAKDLARYYDEDHTLTPRGGGVRKKQTRQVLQQDLKNTLAKHAGKDIMLLAHSMGTIIAYDVLRDITRQKEARFKGLSIKHFVTLGAPLGLPHVRAKIMTERNYTKKKKRSVKDVRTPTIVSGSWLNFADKKDPVALDVHLSDDYSANTRGVQVEDDLVNNNYRRPQMKMVAGEPSITRDPNGAANHHKSYGYLRAPEVSAHIARFLMG